MESNCQKHTHKKNQARARAGAESTFVRISYVLS